MYMENYNVKDEKYLAFHKELNDTFNRTISFNHLKISNEFKDKIIEILFWATKREYVYDDVLNYMRSSSNVQRAKHVLYSLFSKLEKLDDDINIYPKLKKELEQTEIVSNVIRPYVLSMVDSAFESIYTEEKCNELIDSRNSKQILTLNEADFVRIMEEHHRWKWGRHMPFIVEKRREHMNGDQAYGVKPRYVYRDENSEFYVNTDLIKTILSEYFDEYEVDYIEFDTSHIKENWVYSHTMVRRDNRGCPADQDSMRIMRHPGMYEHGDVTPTFNCVKVHVRNRKKDNNYQLVR